MIATPHGRPPLMAADTQADRVQPTPHGPAVLVRFQPLVNDDEDFLRSIFKIGSGYAETSQRAPHEGCMLLEHRQYILRMSLTLDGAHQRRARQFSNGNHPRKS